MRVITTVQEMVSERKIWAEIRLENSRTGGHSAQVGLVPTMGYLHAGHVSLVQQARTENDILTASIFVNPTQFGPHEDLASYPRDLPRDLYLLENLGVDVVFTPQPSDVYPGGFATYVDPTGPLANQAEGASRPGHFRGVATVVLKLFQIMQPHQAYFGQKDAQQVAVISRMVADLNLPVSLRVLPTVREPDGLAMSSRNAYLTPVDRAAATILYRALQAGKQAFESRPSEGPRAVEQAMTEVVLTEPTAQLDYAQVRDPMNFLRLETFQAPALLVIAARVGPTRLIDNFLLRSDDIWDTGVLP